MNDFPRWHEYFPAWHQPSFCDGFCLSQPPFVTYFSRVCKRNISITTGLTSTANHSNVTRDEEFERTLYVQVTKCKAMSGTRRCCLNEEIVHAPFRKKNWFEDLLDWTTLVLTKKCNEKKLAKFVVFKKERRILKWVSFSKKVTNLRLGLVFHKKFEKFRLV